MYRYIFWTALVLSFVLFFGKIAINGVEHKQYIAKFTVQCESKGGIVKIPKGVKGWPMPDCLNPEAIIDIEIIRQPKP